MKSKFLQAGGNTFSKTETSANPHCPVYVPDPTSTIKPVSREVPVSLWAAGCCPNIALTASCLPKAGQGELGVKGS